MVEGEPVTVRRSVVVRVVAPLLLLAAVASACSTPSGGGALSGSVPLNPAASDPAIAADPVFTHLAWPAVGTPRNELVVLFHGTQGNPQALTEMAKALQSDGFHVLGLRYQAPVSTFAACPDAVAASDPDCHRGFRAETVFGEGVSSRGSPALDSPALTTSAGNSVMNRLLKAVDYLALLYPTAGWRQFQARDGGGACESTDTTYGACDLRWDHVSVVGHSQGSGVALYLSKYVPLRRVGLVSGTYDGFTAGAAPGPFVYTVAPWVAEGPLAVTPSQVTTFWHTGDPGLGLFRSVADAVGVPGTEVPVTANSAPFGGTNRLATSAASTCPFEVNPPHLAPAVDLCAPDGLYTAAWRYLVRT